jgi:hypothetical protein
MSTRPLRHKNRFFGGGKFQLLSEIFAQIKFAIDLLYYSGFVEDLFEIMRMFKRSMRGSRGTPLCALAFLLFTFLSLLAILLRFLSSSASFRPVIGYQDEPLETAGPLLPPPFHASSSGGIPKLLHQNYMGGEVSARRKEWQACSARQMRPRLA